MTAVFHLHTDSETDVPAGIPAGMCKGLGYALLCSDDLEISEFGFIQHYLWTHSSEFLKKSFRRWLQALIPGAAFLDWAAVLQRRMARRSDGIGG